MAPDRASGIPEPQHRNRCDASIGMRGLPGMSSWLWPIREAAYIVVIARSDLSAVAQRAKAEATKQSRTVASMQWIASRSLSSGAHSRDPLARNDGLRSFSCLTADMQDNSGK